MDKFIPEYVHEVVERAKAFRKNCKYTIRCADYEFFKGLLHARGFFEYDKLIADALEI